MINRGNRLMERMISDNQRGIFPRFNQKEKKMRSPKSGSSCLIMFVLILAVFVAMVCWTDRSMDFWLTYAKGVPTNCPWWLSAVITVAAPVAFLGNVVTEVCRLIL